MPAVQSEVLSLWEIREYLRLISANGTTVSGAIGPILAGNNNIGDVDINSALPTGTNIIGATKDAGANWTSVYTYTTSADMSTAAAISAAPPAQQYIVIDDVFFSTDTAMNFEFEEETSGTVLFKVYTAANTTIQFTPRGKVKLATANKKVFGDASASGNVAITLVYHYEA
jgi:hypothetical protein